MSDVKALFGLIDKKNKRRLIGAVICCVLSVLCGILPYLGVWGIVTCFLNERTENLFQYVCLIAAAIILKHLLFGTGTKISHKVAYQTLGETRKKLFRKIARLPMGYVKQRHPGRSKRSLWTIWNSWRHFTPITFQRLFLVSLYRYVWKSCWRYWTLG